MASSSTWGWIAAGTIGVVGLLWLGRKPTPAGKSSSARNATSAPASSLALPSQLTALEYYTQTVKQTGLPLEIGAKSATIFSFPQTNQGLSDYQTQYVRDHFGKPPAQVGPVWEAQQKLFADRFAAGTKDHPDDFSPAPDKWSKFASLVFRPEHTLAYVTQSIAVPLSPNTSKTVTKQVSVLRWGWFVTDEFGRPYEGWGAGGGLDFLQVVSTVSNAVLPWIPGYGTAANVAIQATIAVAQGKSMQDVALAAARAALPAGAAFAFDLGVGIVLEGKSPKDAVIQAAVTELDKKYPGARAAFEQGQAMAKAYGQKPQTTQGLVFGGVF